MTTTNQQRVVQHTAPTGLNGKLVIESTWGGAFYLYDLASGALLASARPGGVQTGNG